MIFKSIRTQLLGLVVATAVPLTALSAGGLWSQWQSDQAEAVRRAREEARLLALQVDDHFSNLETLLLGLARSVSTDPADAAANDQLLRQVKSELPSFISILVFSPDGTNIGTSGEFRERINVRDRDYFQQILAGKQLSIGNVVRGRSSGQWFVTIARAINDPDGNLRGVILVGPQLEHFQNALRMQALPPDSVVRIVNDQGIVVARSLNAADWIGRDLSKFDHGASHLTSGKSAHIALWSDGVERITGSAQAKRIPWLVSVGLPTEIAFAAVATRLKVGALFITGTLLAVLAIAWLLSGRIARPLRQLGKDASILAAGALSHRTAVATRDEVGVLAKAFNSMAASLERRQEEADRIAEEVKHTKDTLAAVIDASPVAIAVSDMDRRIMLWSRAAEELYGYTAEEAIGSPVKIVPPSEWAQSSELYRRARSGEKLHNIQGKRMRKDGSLVDVRLAAAPMFNTDGSVRGVAWAHEDITEHKRAEQQLLRLAHYDPLTGLPNRISLQQALAARLNPEDGNPRPTSIALFDLDGFKDVNDTLGHSTGDQLLVEVGRRLSEMTTGREIPAQVCRLGGDEFVVIIPDCGDPRVIGSLVDSMLKRLAEPFKINDHDLHLAGSAGLAIAPNDGATVDELIANADLALYQAKADGGRRYRFFLPVLRAQAQARRGLDLELRRAFVQNELEIFFQPLVRLADRAVVGAEALLRWRHPERGLLAPGAFIEILSESAIATDVSSWVFRTACEQVAVWRSRGLMLGRIAINVFPSQLQNERLLSDVDEVLQAAHLPPEALELEITENVALNYDYAANQLQRLRQKGVKLAFDDFGTGYASLSSLTQFPLSRIKIDRSFIRRIADDAEDAAIVRSLIAMAHNLGLAVIAEGIETEAQAAILLHERCEEAQGFLFAKPLPASEFETYLRMQRLATEVDSEKPAIGRRGLQGRPVALSKRKRFRGA